MARLCERQGGWTILSFMHQFLEGVRVIGEPSITTAPLLLQECSLFQQAAQAAPKHRTFKLQMAKAQATAYTCQPKAQGLKPQPKPRKICAETRGDDNTFVREVAAETLWPRP